MDEMKPARTKNLNLRLSETEREKLAAAAAEAGLSLSDFVRQKIGLDALKKPAPDWKRKCPDEKIVRHVRAADPELVRHLAGIGNNLNQLAMWANRHKAGIDAAKIIRALGAIEEELKAVANAHKVH